MRLRTVLLVIIVSAGLLLEPAAAKTFVPTVKEPKTYKEAEQGVLELKANMKNVACGGWQDGAMDASKNFFPVVRGAPGRDNTSPLTKKKTGLGTRGAFRYPTIGATSNPADTEDNTGAWGFLSACDIHQEKITVQVSTMPDQFIDVDINPKVDANGNPSASGSQLCVGDRRTPKDCKKLYLFLRSQAARYKDLKECSGLHIPLCFDDNESDPSKYYTKECAGTQCEIVGTPEFGYFPAACGVMPDGTPWIIPGFFTAGPTIASFYRHYSIRVETAKNNLYLRGECYDYYRPENDPKTTRTSADDEQCELTMSTSSGATLPKPDPEWKPAESQKGSYLPDATLFTPDVRDARTATEPWVPDTETNLNMLDMKKILKRQADFTDEWEKNNITSYLSTELPVKQKASKTLASVRTDAFDDTALGVGGSVERWWESQQRIFSTLTRQPALHLKLPARFALGLSKDDPLLKFMSNAPSQSNGIVEVTVHAGDDELGALLASLKKYFPLPVEEVRIPVVVPLVSGIEADERITEWRLWQMQNPDRAGEADPIIQLIEMYRDEAEKARVLRTALPKTLQSTFALQEKIRRFFSSWETENANRMRTWLQISTQRQELQRLWQSISTSMLEATECQLQWCSNQRYSTPVYSLLDNWLLSRHTLKLPTLPKNVPLEPDRTLDLSWLSLSGGALKIPVLDPIMARVSIPVPPDGLSSPPHFLSASTVEPADILASLPPVPDILFPSGIDYDEASKTFIIADDYLIPTPQAPQLNEAIAAAQSIDQMITGDGSEDSRDSMKGAYCRFSKSLLADDKERSKKIVHIENDLKERVARLVARYMPNMDDDFVGRQERVSAYVTDPTCAGDSVCTHPRPVVTTSWQWQWLLHAPGNELKDVYAMIRRAVIPPRGSSPYLQTTVEMIERIFPPSLPLPSVLAPLKP